MKTNLLIGLILFLTIQSFAQTKWYKYPSNPVFHAGQGGDWDEDISDFDIIYENNEYHMWYFGNRKDDPFKESFRFASSPDGIHWKKYDGNSVMFNSDSIGWGNNMATFDIIKKDSLYLMWYTAEPKESMWASCIGFAWSDDGLTWNNHPEPVLTPGAGNAWDGKGVSNPNVIFDGQMYHMWFAAWPNRVPKIANAGYATSSDGINWKKHPANPVLEIGEPGSWDDHWAVGFSVILNGSFFEMWYFGWNQIKCEVGFATSRDGIIWNKSPENPILKAGEFGAWDAIMVGRRVLSQDSVYSMWYSGIYNIKTAYGYATTSQTEAENWKKNITETQQRVIRVQIFNKLEFINIDSLLQTLQELSGVALIDAYNKLALAYSLNDESKSYNYAEKASELSIKENYPKGKAMALYCMGNSQYVLNNYSEALASQLTALRLFDSLGMQLEVGNLLSQLASIHTYAGSYDQACKYHQQSLDVFTALKDTNSMLNTMNYLGEAYLLSGDTMRALRTYEKELLLAKETKQPINQGFAYEGIGRCYQDHSLDSSIYYFTKASVIWETASPRSQAAINYLLLAETYLTSGPEYCMEAEECLQQSLDLLLIGIWNWQDQLRWCYRMAELYMATQRYDKAREYIDLSLNMCQSFLSIHDHQHYVSVNKKLEFGILLKEYMEKIYQLYHNLDIALQDKDGALHHFMLATAWSDSVSNDHAWKKVAMIQGQFETEKTQNQITVLEKDNELKNLTLKKSRIYLFGLGGLVLIIIIGAIILIRNRKIKAQHIIELERVKSEKLQELDHLKSQFFANISHEFRTPLTLIMGPLNRILSRSEDKNDKKELSIARKYAGNLHNLINNLLSISKLESGKMLLQASETDIVRLIRIYLQAFESLATQKNIELKFTSKNKEIQAFIDREKFEQVLNNLLSNAFRYTDEGGRINVGISSQPSSFNFPEGSITITVSDTGQGIAPEHMQHIFDRFYQAGNNETSYFEGTGIGLALTKELLELHYGTIKVDSEQGKGSIFTISLHLGKGHLKPEEIAHDNPEDIISPIVSLPFPDDPDESNSLAESDQENKDKQPILLIVEDNEDMRSYIRMYFKKEFQIIEAFDGADGYNKSTEHIPDIIISDVMMPNIDGNEFCKKVKSDERTSHIPVILLTARASKESRIEGLEKGADDFITKPFDGEELQVRVKNLIDQRKILSERYRLGFEIIKSEIPEHALSMDEQFLKKAETVVESNLSNPEYGVVNFASDMALSRVQLHRKLRALVDQSVTEFIRTIRLNFAIGLLQRKAGTISEIAYDAGFNNPTYFTISFKKKYGISPSDYLNRLDKD